MLGPVGFTHVTDWLDGSVIVQLTAPVGCTAPATPVTVVVRVVVPPSVGLLEEATTIAGSCWASVEVSVLLAAIA